MQRDMNRAGQDAGRSWSQQFARALDTRGPSQQISRDMGNAGQNAANMFRTNFTRGVQGAISEASGNFGVFSRQAETAMTGLVSKGGLAAAGVAGVGAAALVAGKALYDLGTTWDSVSDGIAAQTGKVGAELDAITKSVASVAQNVALPLDQVGNIAGGVAQALHLTGQPLQTMTEQIAELAEVTGQAVDVRELGRAFRVFGVESAQMPAILDDLYRASTQSGQSVNELIAIATKGAPALSAFGLSIGQSTGLMSLLETSGVDTSTAVNALTIALKKFADGGLAPQQALRDTITQIKALNDAGNQVGAIDLAQTTFGRGFAPIFEAIRSGNLDAQALSNTLQDQTSPSIGDMADATRDAVEQFQLLKNKIAVDFAPAAKGEFEAINRLLTQMFDTLKAIGDGNWSAAFGGIIDDLTKPFTSQDAPWRKWFDQGQPVITDPGTGLPAAQAQAPANSRDGVGVPDFSIDPKTGLPRSQSTAPANSRDSGGLPPGMVPPVPGAPGGPPLILPTEPAAKGTSAGSGPVVPYSGKDPMSLIQGLPVTASLYGSAENLLQSQHKVAQETAELNALMKDNTATADQLTKARNEVADAEREQFKAELSLNEAKTQATQKTIDQMGTAASAITDIGNKLDDDFGISQGLPGIASNIAKFIGNLATAGFQGQLAAIQAANPSKGGYGVMGILGAQGAFGPEHTGLQQQGYPQQGYGAQGSPGTAMAGESARDFAHRVMMPFFQQQGYQVGDHAADKYGEHQNGALDIMVSTIADGNKVLAQVLSDPNTYGAIFDNKVYGYGQGLQPRPYSGGNTGNPTQDHQDHVHALYKPNGGNNIPPGATVGGIPGGAPALGGASPMPNNLPIPLPVVIVGGAVGGAPVAGPPVGGPIGGPAVGAPAPGALPWGAPGGLPTGIGGGGSMLPGAGMPQGFGQSPIGSPGVGAAAGQSPVAPVGGPGNAGWQPQGGGGIGVGGGLAGAALDAGSMALDVMAPGAGQAAQTASKLLSRTVQYGSQVAGIAASGLLETFGLSSDTPGGGLQQSWIGRAVSGLAGAQAAMPGTAGQTQAPAQPAQEQQQQQQPGGPTVNIEHFSQAEGRNGQQAANDLAFKMYNGGGR